jgi:uncharacterized SAM-binding protein YcdF (DUF218 family)
MISRGLAAFLGGFTLLNIGVNDMPSHPLCFLAVSHGYHLPRVKLTFQRAGVEAYTVPARETFVLPHRPFLLAREVVALWAYYLRPISE